LRVDSKSLPTSLCVATIIALALALRLWNLHFGLPEWYHPDEPRKARAIARIATGDLHPDSFYHPSFMLYASALVLRVQHPSGVGIDAQSAARAGRLTVTLLGTATVGLTFVAGLLAYGSCAGLMAALLLAVAPLHVVCSHYLKEDVPLTFWAVATVIASLRVANRGTPAAVTVAALCAGIAAGTKYTGLLFVAVPWLARRQRGDRGGRRIVLAAAVGFLLTTPFALIDLPGFLRGVGYEGGNALTGMAGIRVWPFAYLWTYHLRHSLLPGFGVVPLLAALVGMVIALRRREASDRLLLATVIVLYGVFESSPYKPPPNAERQVVPLLPFLALFAAGAWHRALPSMGVAVSLLLVIVGGPLIASVRLTSAMQPDTRATAAQWLRAHACGNGRIVLEGALNSGGALVPAYVPALPDECNAVYVYSLERDRAAIEHTDFIVASSFMYERYLEFMPPSSPVRQFYETLFATHPIAAEIVPDYKSYGFHNPTIRIYRVAPAGDVAKKLR
jgi:hypothetical protein